MVKNRIPVCHVAVYLRYVACLTTHTMKATKEKINRIIGLDMHPDVFTAAALEKTTADLSKVLWVQDRLPTANLEDWAKKHLCNGDLLVLEASGNSFEVAGRFHQLVSARRAAEQVIAVENLDQAAVLPQYGRARIVPNGLLAGTRFDGDGRATS